MKFYQLKITRLLQLIVLIFLGSCGLIEDAVNPQEEKKGISGDVEGNYQMAYVSNSFFGSTNVQVERAGKDGVYITPNSETGHVSFKADLFEITPGNIGLRIEAQTSGDFNVVGMRIPNSDFDGAYFYDGDTLLYFAIYESLTTGDIDTVVAIGAFSSESEPENDEGASAYFLPMDTLFETTDEITSYDFRDDLNGVVFSESLLAKTMYLTTDGGVNWSSKGIDVEGSVLQSFFVADTLIVTVTDNGKLYFTNDLGSSWNDTEIVLYDDLFQYEGKTYLRDDYYSHNLIDWEEVVMLKDGDTLETNIDLDYAVFVDEDLVFGFYQDYSLSKYYFAKSTNGGEKWEVQYQFASSAYVNSMTLVSESEIFCSGEFSGILHTTDAGLSWEFKETATVSSSYFIHLDGELGFFSEYPCRFTTDGGTTWNPIRLDEYNSLSLGAAYSRAFQGLGNSILIASQYNSFNGLIKIDMADFEPFENQ